MAYCVHCGVELAESERVCPLCSAPVLDPLSPVKEPEKMPYPDRMEEIIRHIDLKFAHKLTLVLLMIPILVVLAADLFGSGGVTWSLYVIGALGCMYCWVMVPVFFRGHRPYLYITVDFFSLTAYLLMIADKTGGLNWFFYLALPILCAVCLTMQLMIVCIRRLEWTPYGRAAAVCALLIAFLMAVDAVCDLFVGRVYLNWSVYAGIPLAALALVFLTLDRRRDMREEIRKRLFI